MRVLFSCHRTGMGGGFSYLFFLFICFNNTMWTLWIYNICTRIPQLLSLSQTLLCLSLSLLFFSVH